MRKRREIQAISISFLDLLSGALGAVIILYVAIPKNKNPEVRDSDPVIKMMAQDLHSTQMELEATKKELAKIKSQRPLLVEAPKAVEPTTVGKDFDVGFKFKGKKIVFLIDTSYSMTEEDRMGQVKAGLKMLLTSMPPDYSIDVIQFPQAERAPFKSLWGEIRVSQGVNRMEAFDFIYSMKPWGGTPTRETLLFALRNYGDASDLVLLSDGAPSYHNSNKKDDIYDILRVVRENNPQKIQINTVGVGSEFIHDKTSDRYKFLALLAEQTGGFFVGF